MHATTPARPSKGPSSRRECGRATFPARIRSACARKISAGRPASALPRRLDRADRVSINSIDYLLTVTAPTMHTASSCEPVPPEQPIAPMILSFSISGIPPREAMTSSRVRR